MLFNLPAISAAVLHGLFVLTAILLLWLWLRKELTPKRFLSIWESDTGVLSSRQILAWVIAIYGMYGRYLGNLDNDGLGRCFEAAFILFGIGGLVQAAAKIKPATTINAKEVGEMTITDKPEASTKHEPA